MKIPSIQSKTIAREWLILVFSILIGTLFSVIFYFQTPSGYLEVRQRLYDALNYKYQYPSNTRTKIFYIEDPPQLQLHTFRPFKEIIVKPAYIGMFERFSDNLESSNKRRVFFDSVSLKYDIGDYNEFERRITPPSIFAGFQKFVKHLFAKWYWFDTWVSVLLPYILFQVLRSVFLSIKILITKETFKK